MNYRSDTPQTDWPDTMAVFYRSEAFFEDLEELDDNPAAPAWHPLERLVAAVPLLCLLAPVADAYMR